jgi:hypothetical protein
MQTIAYFQSAYFLITALWPLIHIESFLRITGQKKEVWLVKTVSVLLCSIGITLLSSAYFNEINRSIIVLALSSAAGLIMIDVYYTIKGKILPVYLADASLEAGLIICWFLVF